jgi:hypothetical protein
MNLTPYVILWSALAFSVLGLALYRKFVASREEDYIHLGPGEEKFIPQQVEVAQSLRTLDHWGSVMTVIAVVSGVVIAAAYLWTGWEASLQRIG